MAKNNRSIRVTPIPLKEPDLRRLARAIIDLAIELNASGTDRPAPAAPLQVVETERDAA